MKVAIVGTGQIGQALRAAIPAAQSIGRDIIDLEDVRTIEAFDWSKFDVIINAAAYTDVDGSETEAGALHAQATNADGVAALATVANMHSLTLVHFSSDYVFDGTSESPYPETATPHPLSAYGRSKAVGDTVAATASKHYIVRTSSVYYAGGKNFVETMLRLGRKRSELAVVSDQVMRPSYAGDIASAVVQLLDQSPATGIYNCQNSGDAVSWADFARTIMQFAGLECTITNITAAEYAHSIPHYAKRPEYGVLDLTKLASLGITMRDWHEALQAYIEST